MKKILVIGANGFLGHSLIAYLKQRYYVMGVFHHGINKLDPEIVNVPIDKITNLKDDFDCIFLLNASISTKTNITPQERCDLFVNNVNTTQVICKHFSNSRIILSSSVSVYEESNNTIKEKASLGGLNEYGISKLWAEHIVKKCNSYGIVRFSSIYGDGMNLTTLLPRYISQALKENKITVWGGGQRRQDFIHVSDAIGYLYAAAQTSLNETFLGVYNESYSNLEVANIISNLTKAKLVFEKEDTSPSFIYDNSYTQQQLCYAPRISIQEGIQSLTQWIKQF